MLFYDYKSVTVKHYGGRRWTLDPNPVLEKSQKTHGTFYLFIAYNVASGRLHWMFQWGKSSVYICRFMRRLRKLYPSSTVLIALDQDSAHPKKSRVTKRFMHQLKLQWISLPKASPDDNPVETMNSDIQLRILDNSNDQFFWETQSRISRHLQAHNRRSNPTIRIGFMPDLNIS